MSTPETEEERELRATELVLVLIRQLMQRVEVYGLMRRVRRVKAVFIHNKEHLPESFTVTVEGWVVLVYREDTQVNMMCISEYQEERVNEEGELEWVTIPNILADYKSPDFLEGRYQVYHPRLSIVQPILGMRVALVGDS